jgi:MFS family permease
MSGSGSRSSSRKKRKRLRHVYLFTDFDFNVYFLNCILWNALEVALSAFGPDLVHSSGVKSLDDAALIMTACGCGVFCGAVFGAIIGSIWTKHHLLQFSSACVLCGVLVAIMPVFNTFTQFVVIFLFAGMCMGVIEGLCSVVLIDLMGMRNFEQAIGFISFANGIGAFIGPLVTGRLDSCLYCIVCDIFFYCCLFVTKKLTVFNCGCISYLENCHA